MEPSGEEAIASLSTLSEAWWWTESQMGGKLIWLVVFATLAALLIILVRSVDAETRRRFRFLGSMLAFVLLSIVFSVLVLAFGQS